MSRQLCLTLAVVSAAGLLAACETDDSLPTHPRTANFLTPDSNAQQNAERKALERPSQGTPGVGAEIPGQSAVVPAAAGKVATLDAGVAPAAASTTPNFHISGFSGPSGWDAVGQTHGPETVYQHDSMYPGLIPHLPENPGTTPMIGSVMAPDGDWAIDFAWGQGLTLKDYPHRPWAPTTAVYQDGTVTHNPVYYFNLPDHTSMPPAGPRTQEITNAVIGFPWFLANTLALPVLMVLEPPLAVRTTSRGLGDPNYMGSIPTGGGVVPVPEQGTLRWDYPFMNADGTIKPPKDLPKSETVQPEQK